ncbi:MAG: Asp23/Gls24 family envelope stress response protein [Planctomycetes bacterium]|nr:Asp23/Gls24 family envelope stress response protein [Planctomycetota bacterium]
MPDKKDNRRKSSPDKDPGAANLVIAPAIIVDIVRKEALNTAGVVEVVGGTFIGRGKGVVVTETVGEENPAYSIEIHLYVEYGTNCHKLAEVLSRRVSDTVGQMTGRDVVDVTVHVEGIRDPVRGEGDEDSDPTLDF